MPNKPMFKYFSSISLCLGLLIISPRSWAKAHKYVPTGIWLGGDVLRPLTRILQQEGTQYQGNLAIDFHHFLLEIDYGIASIAHSGVNRYKTKSSYKNDGQYVRIGCDYNLLKDSPSKNVVFLGFRYAMSFFKDQLQSIVEDESSTMLYPGTAPIWDKRPVNAQQDPIKASWVELVGGVKVKIWQGLCMGYTVRFKFQKSLQGDDAFMPF